MGAEQLQGVLEIPGQISQLDSVVLGTAVVGGATVVAVNDRDKSVSALKLSFLIKENDTNEQVTLY